MHSSHLRTSRRGGGGDMEDSNPVRGCFIADPDPVSGDLLRIRIQSKSYFITEMDHFNIFVIFLKYAIRLRSYWSGLDNIPSSYWSGEAEQP